MVGWWLDRRVRVTVRVTVKVRVRVRVRLPQPIVGLIPLRGRMHLCTERLCIPVQFTREVHNRARNLSTVYMCVCVCVCV